MYLLRGYQIVDRLSLLRHEVQVCYTINLHPDLRTLTQVAIAGIQAQGATNEREVGVVQFYAPSGQHLRSLRVPGQNLRAISWEGSGLRLALAVDSHIFFANIRPDYLWGYFSHTLVYAVLRKERNEHVVIFWDTHTDDA
eukprot:g16295.t1